MRPSRHHTSTPAQRGAALMVMLVILVIGAAAVLVGALNATALRNAQHDSTSTALALAKEALIGYAVTYGDLHDNKTHGYLPCPDMDGEGGGIPIEGTAETCGTKDSNTMGRLPWRTLGLPAPRDGAGECLWYAVSGSYKNNPETSSKMNWDNTGKLKVYSSDGSEIAPDEVVAVIVAPGPISPTGTPAQDRSAANAPLCGGNYAPAAYLDNDTIHGIDNADIAAGKFILPHQHRDANGNVTVAVNDQFAYITRQDIWSAVQRRVAIEAQTCLDAYAASSGAKYPWAVPISTPTEFTPLMMGGNNTLFGRLPVLPNVQTEPITPDIAAMQTRFAELWIALADFAADKNWSNLLIVKAKADAAKDAADAVGDNYDGTPLEPPADALKDGADAARDDLTTSSTAAQIEALQQDITDAANDLATAMTLQFIQAPGMATTWPASCTLFSSAWWDHWKDLVFYQVADGFKPSNNVAACGSTCLGVEGTGHTGSGSGGYRATVIVAGKKLTTNRVAANAPDYLDADNLLPRNDASKPYKTYRATDGEYQTINDLVLCLDGQVNCR